MKFGLKITSKFWRWAHSKQIEKASSNFEVLLKKYTLIYTCIKIKGKYEVMNLSNAWQVNVFRERKDFYFLDSQTFGSCQITVEYNLC